MLQHNLTRALLLLAGLCLFPTSSFAAQQFPVSCLNVQSLEVMEAQGRWNLIITLTQEGSDALAAITAAHPGEVLTITTGSQTLMAARIGGPIQGGKLGLAAPSRGEARDLAGRVCQDLVR